MFHVHFSRDWCVCLLTILAFQIGTLGLLTGIVVVSPRLQNPKWRNLRVFAFVGTGLSAFAPIIHAATIFPYDQLDKQAGLRYYYLEGISILTGVVFYVVSSSTTSSTLGGCY